MAVLPVETRFASSTITFLADAMSRISNRPLGFALPHLKANRCSQQACHVGRNAKRLAVFH